MHPLLPEKLYYGIGELAKAFDVKPSLIRYWEKEFDSFNPRKNAKGTRRYNAKDVEKLQEIYHLVKEKGFTLEGAKARINNPTSTLKVIQKLEKIRAKLDALKQEL